MTPEQRGYGDVGGEVEDWRGETRGVQWRSYKVFGWGRFSFNLHPCLLIYRYKVISIYIVDRCPAKILVISQEKKRRGQKKKRGKKGWYIYIYIPPAILFILFFHKFFFFFFAEIVFSSIFFLPCVSLYIASSLHFFFRLLFFFSLDANPSNQSERERGGTVSM